MGAFIKTSIRILLVVALVCMASSCSLTRNVQPGEKLLRKVEISSADTTFVPPLDFKQQLFQRPNSRFLGLFPMSLYVYNLTTTEAKGWIPRWIRSIGQAPVIYDPEMTVRSELALVRSLELIGYMNSSCVAEVDSIGSNMVGVRYVLHPGRRYDIESVEQLVADSSLLALIGEPDDRLKIGDILSPKLLDADRHAHIKNLANKGYWGLVPDVVRYEADTVRHKGSAVLRRIVERTDLLPYRYGEITVRNRPVSEALEDDLIRASHGFLFRSRKGDKVKIRPVTLARNIFIRQGEYYNQEVVNRSHSALVSLPALNTAVISFRPDSTVRYDGSGKPYRLLNTDVVVNSGNSKTISGEITGTNSAGDFGVAASVGFVHRNLFRGSELFSYKLRGGYEAIGRGRNSFFEYGMEASIRFPHFIFPFFTESVRKRHRATTELLLSYDYQSRPEFSRRILSGRWAYNWRPYGNEKIRHQLRLIDIDYLHMPYINEEFRESLPPSAELYNYTDQFVAGAGYTFNLTNATPMQKRNAYSLRLSLELAGNLLQGISALSKAPRDEHGSYKFLGVNYAQFVKFDASWSQSWHLSNRSSFALHSSFGIAYPYGNAERIPFDLRYFGGGANGVRGWSVRSLGPGAMARRPDLTIYDAVGDINFVANAEFRTSLFWKLELAAYVDAGNIWTIRSYDSQPGGEFRFDKFYKQIALSYGLGLRLNFDFFVIRLDTGYKVYDPQATYGHHWLIGKPNFGQRFAWHFAVGYPF